MEREGLENRSWRLLFEISERMRSLVEKPEVKKAAAGVTIAQAKVMLLLFDAAPESVPQSELVRQLGVTPGAVSQLVKSLVKRELVERCSGSSDRRAVTVKLSKRSEEFHSYYEKALSGVMGELLAGIDPADGEIFVKVLKNIRTRLREKAGVAV